MTEEELDGLESALDDFLEPYLFCCDFTQTFGHLHTYCRGLLSDLKRKSVEPIALAAGCAVRTLQEFLRDHQWRHTQLREQLQCTVAADLARSPGRDHAREHRSEVYPGPWRVWRPIPPALVAVRSPGA